MIRRFGSFGLVLLVLVGIARAQEIPNDRTAMDSARRITISCDPGAPCVAKPDHLESWPKKIVVVSSETWDCHIVAGTDPQSCTVARNLPAGSDAILELHSTEAADHVVRLAVIDPNRGQHGLILPIASLGTTLMALFIAAWVVYLAWDSTGAGKRPAAALEASIQDLEAAMQRISDTLLFPEPRDPRPPAGVEPVLRTSEVEALKAEIGEFVQYVKDCFTSLQKAPHDAYEKIRELEAFRAQAGPRTDAADAMVRYKQMAKTLARFALAATEDDFKKSRSRNPTAEEALRRLLEIVGFSLLVPKPRDKYMEGRHTLSGQTERTEHRSNQGSIARVERRGLLDSENEVIQKAEVVLFDYRPQ